MSTSKIDKQSNKTNWMYNITKSVSNKPTHRGSSRGIFQKD